MRTGLRIFDFGVVQRFSCRRHTVKQPLGIDGIGHDVRFMNVRLRDGQLNGRARAIGHIFLDAPQHILGMELLYRAI